MSEILLVWPHGLLVRPPGLRTWWKDDVDVSSNNKDCPSGQKDCSSGHKDCWSRQKDCNSFQCLIILFGCEEGLSERLERLIFRDLGLTLNFGDPSMRSALRCLMQKQIITSNGVVWTLFVIIPKPRTWFKGNCSVQKTTFHAVCAGLRPEGLLA